MQLADSLFKVYQNSREMFAVESSTYIDIKFLDLK